VLGVDDAWRNLVEVIPWTEVEAITRGGRNRPVQFVGIGAPEISHPGKSSTYGYSTSRFLTQPCPPTLT
jgi:hypothetical protein